MPDRLREILNNIVAWWKRFTRKQQAIIVSSALVVALAIGILAFVLSRPEMVRIKVCETQKEAATVRDLLEEEGIYHEISDDGLVFTIKKKDMSAASILLGSNQIETEDAQLKEILSGGLSSTEDDKAKLYQDYQQNELAEILESLNNVEHAEVLLDLPKDDGTLKTSQEEASASVFLTLDGEMEEEQAIGLAKMVATRLGNETTDNIAIMDSNMNLLFAGGTDSSTVSASTAQLSTKQKTEAMVESQVKKVFTGTGLYQSVDVGTNIALNLDENEVTDLQYSVPEGRDEGYLDTESAYESESEGGVTGVPGTDSNGEDGAYVIEDGSNSSQTITDYTRKYDVNQRVEKSKSAIGDIDYENSSLSISARQYVKYDEDTLKANGTLDDMSFEEYRAQIEAQPKEKLTVDQDLYTLVSNATGIAQDRITIVAYAEPVFITSSGSGRTLSDYLEILLAVLIFALLGFVVFMSMRKDRQEEVEPELSVESLLAATREEEEEENLEDIGFKEKSEARMLIEKFVDEKPEAVASLLRNWLNEDWE